MRRVRPVRQSALSRFFHHILRTELGRIRLLIISSILMLFYLSNSGTTQLSFAVPPAIFICEVLIIFSVGLFSIVYAFELSSIGTRITVNKPGFQRTEEERVERRALAERKAAIKL